MWSAYLRVISGNAPQKDIAERVGVTQPTVSRWLDGLVPTSAAVVAHVARQYDRNPLEAFVVAGMLSTKEAGRGLSDAEKEFLQGLAKPKRRATGTQSFNSRRPSSRPLRPSPDKPRLQRRQD